MSAEELQDAKDSVGQLVALLPEECLVGLVTFGATVVAHELCESAMPRSYVLRGTDDITQEQLKRLLQLELSPHEHATYDKIKGSAVAESNAASRRFILPVSECEFALQTILDELEPDPFPREPGTRPFRATGVAIAVAQGLVAESHSAQGARVMVFTSGPCTMGPGTVVGRDMSENLRTHADFNKGSAKHFKAACKYYNSLGIRLATHAHTLDVFACSLDQVGLAEMKTAVDQTGGVMVLAEQFRAETFRSSLRGLFKRDASGALDMYFNATFCVFCVPQVMVCGGIGPMSALAVKSKSISENEVGMGQTTSWRVCSLNTTTSVAVYYEIVNQHSNPIPGGDAFYLQFCVRYKRSNGEIRLRVMTVARRWAESSAAHEIVAGFDQEASALLMARVSTFRVEHEETFDLLRWLDRTAHSRRVQIREYARDAPETFRMPGPMAIYPQFMFNLRRSQFLQTANNSPDETAYYRLMIGREDGAQLAGDDPTHPDVVHLQRTAAARAVGRGEHPAGLHPPLDTYFMIVVHAGQTIAAWRKANYQEQPEHEAFRNLLAKPVADAAAAWRGGVPPRDSWSATRGPAGAFSVGQVESFGDARHVGRGWRGGRRRIRRRDGGIRRGGGRGRGDHLDRRHLPERLHAAPRQAGGAVVGDAARERERRGRVRRLSLADEKGNATPTSRTFCPERPRAPCRRGYSPTHHTYASIKPLTTRPRRAGPPNLRRLSLDRPIPTWSPSRRDVP